MWPRGDDGGAKGLFETLRIDAANVLSAPQLRAISRDPVALEALGSRTLTRGALRDYLDEVLRRQDEGISDLVRNGLEPGIAACLAEELKTNNGAWLAYQRLSTAWLMNGITLLRGDVGATGLQLADIQAAVTRLEAANARLVALPVDDRDPGGQAVLDEILASQDRILDELSDRLNRLEGVVRTEAATVRADVEEVGARVDALRERVAPGTSGAFESVDDFFRPFQDPERVFSHAFPLVGREAQAELLAGLVGSQHRVAVLSAAGGVGKSRLLKEVLARIEAGEGGASVSILADPTAFDPRMLDDFAGIAVLALDDAHRHLDDLRRLAAAIAHRPGRFKLMLAARPYALPEVRRILLDARFGSEETLEVDLPFLSRPVLLDLAKEILGPDLENSAERILDAANNSPLVTVVAARLLVLHEIDPARLVDTEQARAEIFDRFGDVLVGDLGLDVEPAQARDALALISAIGPLRSWVNPLVERASEFLGLPRDRFVILLGRLADAGALVHPDGAYRIAPDLLSTHVLKAAAVSPTGGSNGFAERLIAHFGDLITGTLLRNLVDLLPGEVLGYARAIVDRGPVEVPDVTLADVLADRRTNPYDGLPEILRSLTAVTYLRADALDVLWRLGRDYPGNPRGSLDHPMRVLEDMGELLVGGDRACYDALVDAAARWVDAPGAFGHRHSPLVAIENLLDRRVAELGGDGVRTIWTDFPVCSSPLGGIRRRAIQVVVGITRSNDPVAQHRALSLLLEVLWTPWELDVGRVGPEEAAARERENQSIFVAIRALLGRVDSPFLSCVVARHLRDVRRRAGDTPTGASHRALLAELPPDLSAAVTRYVWLGRAQIDFFPDEEDFQRRSETIDRDVQATAEHLIDAIPETDRLKQRLEAEISSVTRHGVEAHPGLLLEVIAKYRPGTASALIGLVIADPASALVRFLPSLIIPYRDADPDGFSSFILAALESTDAMVLAAVAQSLGYIGPLQESEREAVRRLSERSEAEVVFGVLGALRRFPPDAAHEVDEIVEVLDVGEGMLLAEPLSEVYLRRADEGLAPQVWDMVLGKLVATFDVPEGGTALHSLIDALVRRDPVRAVTFFQDRIRRRLERDDNDRRDYQPVPYARLTTFSAGQADPAARREALGRVTAELIAPGAQGVYWLVDLFALLANGFDEVAVGALSLLVADEGRYGIDAVRQLLDRAPNRLVFDHPGFVELLLSEAGKAGRGTSEEGSASPARRGNTTTAHGSVRRVPERIPEYQGPGDAGNGRDSVRKRRPRVL